MNISYRILSAETNTREKERSVSKIDRAFACAGSSYPPPRCPSRLSAALRPLARRFGAALTAISARVVAGYEKHALLYSQENRPSRMSSAGSVPLFNILEQERSGILIPLGDGKAMLPYARIMSSFEIFISIRLERPFAM